MAPYLCFLIESLKVHSKLKLNYLWMTIRLSPGTMTNFCIWTRKESCFFMHGLTEVHFYSDGFSQKLVQIQVKYPDLDLDDLQCNFSKFA